CLSLVHSSYSNTCISPSVHSMLHTSSPSQFFSHDTSTTELYTLSLHDALPISIPITDAYFADVHFSTRRFSGAGDRLSAPCRRTDRKSTRLNSSHVKISYAVFCLKKKKNIQDNKHHKNKITKS